MNLNIGDINKNPVSRSNGLWPLGLVTLVCSTLDGSESLLGLWILVVREDSLAGAAGTNQIRGNMRPRGSGGWLPTLSKRIRAGDLIMSASIFRANTCHREWLYCGQETGARVTIELWGAMGVGVCGSG